MNGVSDITFPRLLSTQDKHICCIAIAVRNEKMKERKKERTKNWKEGKNDYIIISSKTEHCRAVRQTLYYFNAQCSRNLF